MSRWKVLLLLTFYSLTSLSQEHKKSFTNFCFNPDKDFSEVQTEKPPSSLKIILMRHGQSEQNVLRQRLWKIFRSRRKAIEYQLKELDSTKLVDALLTPKGVEQAKEAGRKLAKAHPNIKYVFLSPMRRTVETSISAMNEYFPNSDPEYLLNPWMRESIQTLADIPLLSYDFLAKYPSIDRSLLASNPKLWFLDYFVDSRTTGNKHLLEKAIRGRAPLKKLQRLLAEYPEGFEHPSQIGLRLNSGLQMIRDFVRQKYSQGTVVKDNEILLVSHGFLLCDLLGFKVVYPNDTYGGLVRGNFGNAELKSYELVNL